MGEDEVFRALADPTRRLLLDRLRERTGQSLGELCGEVGMTRQAVTQHLDVLESANLISTVRQGRQKLHYLNVVPLHEMQERWIGAFERPRLRTLRRVRRRAEEQAMADPNTFVYVTFIRSTPEVVWDALTDADLTADYWGHRNESDWEVGSPWQHVRPDGSGTADVVGTVLESVRPERLVITFGEPDGDPAAAARVTFEITPHHDIVRLQVTHQDLARPGDLELAAAGWSAVFANLKTLLETGRVLPQPPWEMHAHLREQQLR